MANTDASGLGSKMARETILNSISRTGYSVEEFANHFEIPIQTLFCWIKGKRYPREYIANLISRLVSEEEARGVYRHSRENDE